MSNKDLDSFDNFYVGLSQSAYTGRPNSFAAFSDSDTQIEFDFSKDVASKNNSGFVKGGKNLPNHGKVYLQPDETEKTVIDWKTGIIYKKSLLTDKLAGFNAYFVTDTPTLNSETKNTYFVVRGSDGMSLKNLNDWLGNNADFTLNDSYIKQAKLSTEAMQQKIKEMSEKAPNAKMSVTGHSLGSIVSIQSVANLPPGDIDKIDKLVLFQGPDARESILKMSPQAQKNIQKLEDEGKIEYYVNAFDLVSMLNRNKKGVNEIGKVNYLLPKTFTTTFDQEAEGGSSHDFGQYQHNSDGSLKVANVKEHPAIFVAGAKLSKFIDEYVNLANDILDSAVVTGPVLLKAILGGGIRALVALGLTVWQAYKIYNGFKERYADIVNEAKFESEFDDKVESLQKSIGSSSGSRKIELREKLAKLVASKAKKTGEQYEILVTTELDEEEDEITEIADDVSKGAKDIQKYLSFSEVESITASFRKENLWDSGRADENRNEAKKYADELTNFCGKLNKVADNITAYDGQAGREMFENNL